MTDAATQLSGAKFGAFFYNTTDVQGNSLMLYTLSGAPRAAFEKLGRPRTTSLFEPTFHGDKLIRCNDIVEDPRYGTLGGMPKGHLPVRSYLAVPVVSRSGHPIGGLLFGHPEPGVFTERTERLIVGVAGQAAIAVDNARLYEAAQKAAEEREALLTRERSAREEAERLSKMKDEFLAMLAHELRNPLAPISSAAEILGHLFANEPRVKQTSAIIKRQVSHMTRLVDDLLDVSRVTRGLVTLDKKVIDFRQVVSGAIDQIRPLADEKGHLLVVDLPDSTLYTSGDQTRLIQAIANILNNAVKYTPIGGRIEMNAAIQEKTLCFTVRDNGSGMPPDLVPQVFDLFTQGARTLARSQGGLGLGLALVKKLVELHGGEVAARSAGVGQGSEFLIQLPLLQLTGYGANDMSPSVDGLSLEGLPVPIAPLQVLVIDDNIDGADTLAMAVTVAGHSVRTAYTAQSALDQVVDETPDVFLVDIGLPDIDGYALAARLKSMPHTASATLIAVTGYGQARDKERTGAAGFAHHLVKPIDVHNLTALLAKISPVMSSHA